MSLFRLALEGARLPLAVVIQGNPKYLHEPQVAPLARAFYAQVKQLLQAQGYRVEFDFGAEHTLPNPKAVVWVGHSRGIDRLRFAPASVRTVELQTLDHGKHYDSIDQRGRDPDHYQLSPQDIKALQAL